MQYFQDVLTLSTISTSLWDAYDLIGLDGAKIDTDDAPVLGVAKHPNTVIGDPGAVMAIGTARVKAVGAVTRGPVVSADGGVSVAAPDAENPFATALNAAADGEFVTILIR